jgi:hypothetical protein
MMLRCMSPEVAQNGHGVMSDLSPLSGVKRKFDFGAVRSAFDPNTTSSLLRIGYHFSLAA